MDVSMRGAVSIARRLLDPLAELVILGFSTQQVATDHVRAYDLQTYSMTLDSLYDSDSGLMI